MKPRFIIGPFRASDSKRTWQAVFDTWAPPRASAWPICMRATRKACENFVKQTWKEIRAERSFNKRRRIRLAKELANP
jgi:hypothetical protein